MIEAPPFAPTLIDGSIPITSVPQITDKEKCGQRKFPPPVNYANIPEHLIKATDKLGTERARFVENRLLNILAPYTMIIRNIHRNEFGSEEDGREHDLTGIFVNGESFWVQGKADRDGVVKYKHEIADKLFGIGKKIKPRKPKNRAKYKQIIVPDSDEQLIGQWSREAAVSEYLTNKRIILLNGTQYKSNEDIMDNSFYPQADRILTRIMVKAKQETHVFGDYTTGLGLKGEIVQVFPKPISDEQLDLPLAA